jgi:Iodothyronine deiodinase
MFEKYRDRANFLTVYIKEAHAQDEWKMKENDAQGICYAQPRTLVDRRAIARDFQKRFHYTMPLLVDRMNDRANALYAGWPERIYVIDENGKIVYKGKPGPFGYHPEEVEQWLAKRFPG